MVLTPPLGEVDKLRYGIYTPVSQEYGYTHRNSATLQTYRNMTLLMFPGQNRIYNCNFGESP